MTLFTLRIVVGAFALATAVAGAGAQARSWAVPPSVPGAAVTRSLVMDATAGARAAEGAVPDAGTYAWPVRGPVVRGFEAPADPYGPGHRGIDIAVPQGTEVRAAADGVVAFAGPVGGALFVSIDHADGVRTTYSWLSLVGVHRGESVRRGEVIASTGQGHPELGVPNLHFGARIGDEYLDPLLLLDPADVVGIVHLAPLDP